MCIYLFFVRFLSFFFLRYPGTAGVSEVIDPSKLSLLTAGELQRLVGGEAAGGADGDLEWDYHRIMESLVCRHGYSVESAQVWDKKRSYIYMSKSVSTSNFVLFDVDMWHRYGYY